MFINFAIQGLNDYFATATSPDAHDPTPRTYTQVTMRDEGARFSSRPGSMEDSTGDGYAFTLEAHRRYRIKQMWAMNGGLLDLLAHDCPDELAQMHDDMTAGLLEPVVAGFGAHRLPYYQADTNCDAITAGAEAMEHMLGAAPGLVYYPDSRIVTGTPDVADALRRARVRYLVVDAGESKDGQQLRGHPTGQRGAAAERGVRGPLGELAVRCGGTGSPAPQVLFIDPEMKDGLFEATDREADRGKVSLGIRRKFIELAAQPVLRRDNLLVYSDDADKASGNGWFDGVYNGGAVQFNRKYQAALSLDRGAPVGAGRDHRRPRRRRLRRRAGPARGQRPVHPQGVGLRRPAGARARQPARLRRLVRAAGPSCPPPGWARTCARSPTGPSGRSRSGRARTSSTSWPGCTWPCACTSRSGPSGPATGRARRPRTSSSPSRCSCATCTST